VGCTLVAFFLLFFIVTIAAMAHKMQPPSSKVKLKRALRSLVRRLSASFGPLLARALASYALACVAGALFLNNNNQGALSLSFSESMSRLPALAGEAAVATKAATFLWLRVAQIAVTPGAAAVRAGSEWALPRAAAYVAGLSRATHLTLAAIFGALGLCLFTEREIRRRKYVARTQAAYMKASNAVKSRYTRIASSVRAKSRLAAAALPHVIFAAGCVAGLRLFPAAGDVLVDLGWVIKILWPLLATVAALSRHVPCIAERSAAVSARESTKSGMEKKSRDGERKASFSVFSSVWSTVKKRVVATAKATAQATSSITSTPSPPKLCSCKRATRHELLPWLGYWGNAGVLALFERLPVAGHFMSAVPYWELLRVLFALWQLNPLTNGMRFRLPLGRAGYQGGGVPANSSMLLRMLPRAVSDMLSTGGTLVVLALPFLFTPGFFAEIGVTLVAFGHASYVTFSLATEVDSKVALPVDACITQSAKARCWLQYWCVNTALFSFRHQLIDGVIGWMPFWTHANLIFVVWLQLPYFSGAARLYARTRRSLLEIMTKTKTTPVKINAPRPSSEKAGDKGDASEVEDDVPEEESGEVRENELTRLPSPVYELEEEEEGETLDVDAESTEDKSCIKKPESFSLLDDFSGSSSASSSKKEL